MEGLAIKLEAIANLRKIIGYIGVLHGKKERRDLRQERDQRVEEKRVRKTADKRADTNNKFPSITKTKWDKVK